MKIVLGVGGGIAAYKAAELIRLLTESGAEVQVVMTSAAQEFIRPLTFAALTSKKVITDLFASGGSEETLSTAIEHIRVARENDVLVVAPATADLMAKFAHGLADDFLSTMYLAFQGRVVLAPAMNTNMWQHPATQANLARLRERGCEVVEPGEGPLACGMTGPGRLAEPGDIANTVIAGSAQRQDLEGETVVITAGPTEEPLDPVRFISNRSSGKMGYALARAAAARGAEVVLISGPVALPEPAGVTLVPVRTATEMRQAVMDNLPRATVIIKAAAVADYHLANVPRQKMKKTAARLSLELDPTPDILAEVGRKKEDRLLIGFAAETENLVAEARRKMESKNCDMVVANLVGREGAGFSADENEVTLLMRTGESIKLPLSSKDKVADWIFDQALKLRLSLHAAQ
ncbi:MAG: bifunctional phosphopantothenoylcysteine decarboxylase/phosphopantothenate--cysteine ligase CoaBC [bacterium]|nr:bifunctional phosphopantothenoylcysteine decarboxylase/phosphopantothenate--cysteine ligase CoaBC [bacterium]